MYSRAYQDSFWVTGATALLAVLSYPLIGVPWMFVLLVCVALFGLLVLPWLFLAVLGDR